jgi:sugar phosphate isomerase/epimerase
LHLQLPKSCKNRYPFKLGTTSFIYPENYVPNAHMLGPYVDDIELIFFESRNTSLPSRSTVNELRQLARDFDFTYSVHLPIDISIADPQPTRRKRAVDTLARIVDLLSPLTANIFCLHIPYDDTCWPKEKFDVWRDAVRDGLNRLFDSGVDRKSLVVENLDYPITWLDAILLDLDLHVCLDLGHLALNGWNVSSHFDTYQSRTRVLHVHGVAAGRDHLALDLSSRTYLGDVLRILRRFTGCVCLEVFSYRDLLASMQFLEENL